MVNYCRERTTLHITRRDKLLLRLSQITRAIVDDPYLCYIKLRYIKLQLPSEGWQL